MLHGFTSHALAPDARAALVRTLRSGDRPIARELRVFVKADATVDGDTVVPEPFEDRFASAPPGEDDADPADSIPSD